MIQLEKYRGTKSRHTCSKCGYRNCFVRFVNDNGEYISEDVGRCNRESKCGYIYTPKQFFADNPHLQNKKPFKKAAKRKTNTNYGFADKDGSQTTQTATKPIATVANQIDFIPFDALKQTFSHYDKNGFAQFLLHLFPDCLEEIQSVLKMYFVGTHLDSFGNYYTCFPSLDRQMRVCRAKLIRFNRETGKRLKGQFDTSSLPAKLKLKEDFNYKQIFFGEHLLPKFPNKPIAIVEAEKTAIIATLCFPEFIWLASGSKQWLNAERLQRIGQRRQIILYPDADGFEQWQAIAKDAQKQGLTVKASSLIEKQATDQQKQDGYDIADYLINQQRQLNDKNAELEAVLSDEDLFSQAETILNERVSIMEFDGNLSRKEAEQLTYTPENIRAVIQLLTKEKGEK